jgi:hypothetical protein
LSFLICLFILLFIHISSCIVLSFCLFLLLSGTGIVQSACRLCCALDRRGARLRFPVGARDLYLVRNVQTGSGAQPHTVLSKGYWALFPWR